MSAQFPNACIKLTVVHSFTLNIGFLIGTVLDRASGYTDTVSTACFWRISSVACRARGALWNPVLFANVRETLIKYNFVIAIATALRASQ